MCRGHYIYVKEINPIWLIEAHCSVTVQEPVVAYARKVLYDYVQSPLEYMETTGLQHSHEFTRRHHSRRSRLFVPEVLHI
jgi:hypothetical protein